MIFCPGTLSLECPCFKEESFVSWSRYLTFYFLSSFLWLLILRHNLSVLQYNLTHGMFNNMVTNSDRFVQGQRLRLRVLGPERWLSVSRLFPQSLIIWVQFPMIHGRSREPTLEVCWSPQVCRSIDGDTHTHMHTCTHTQIDR